ncbi:flagellar biosynthesis regulator FlaF [Siccirubricoccus sp. KC 17139]|uniref:Flagellar biosynthesis regulator FlaF n=1 Tax=Siccirubricoccus soli TaxID=2899147 RepID=A0ABT1D649_9PROT|nr:flagellar biosynthesis regulator FlaF [Siccirubricoccus soli]MCO6416684.1 flagellar biosynthesis regulator FlaF [Siccirubricoccus soli]MCP2682819.1 flagellar biosynthesis regulator FlaF [Siccirubricoccus soli]
MSNVIDTSAFFGAVASPQPSASGAAAYRRRLSAKQMEAEVFARATRSIRELETGASPLARARAAADNRRLWTAVHRAVLDPTNSLPPELRAQIASVALAVIRECEGEAPDFGFIAEMNEHFAAALWR